MSDILKRIAEDREKAELSAAPPIERETPEGQREGTITTHEALSPELQAAISAAYDAGVARGRKETPAVATERAPERYPTNGVGQPTPEQIRKAVAERNDPKNLVQPQFVGGHQQVPIKPSTPEARDTPFALPVYVKPFGSTFDVYDADGNQLMKQLTTRRRPRNAVPIKPENRQRYPKNWKTEIVPRIRKRSGGRCECTGQCGLHRTTGGLRRCVEVNGQPAKWAKGNVVLTVAHLDHVPENCDDDNLLDLCQRCHLRYDVKHHNGTRRRTREQQTGQRTFLV